MLRANEHIFPDLRHLLAPVVHESAGSQTTGKAQSTTGPRQPEPEDHDPLAYLAQSLPFLLASLNLLYYFLRLPDFQKRVFDLHTRNLDREFVGPLRAAARALLHDHELASMSSEGPAQQQDGVQSQSDRLAAISPDLRIVLELSEQLSGALSTASV